MPCSRNLFKLMAIIFMVIDHTGLFLLDNNIICRGIGRLAFPMFVYLLVDGYHRTKDIRKYLLRLAFLYIVSYVPHSLAMSGGLFYVTQNIYASQFLYLILFYLLGKKKMPAWSKLLSIGMAGLLAVTLHLQYSWYGVAVAVIMFYLNDNGVQNACLALLFLGWIYHGRIGFPLQSIGALAVFFVPYRGNFMDSPKPNKLLQWVNYFFYPVHLLFFAILRL